MLKLISAKYYSCSDVFSVCPNAFFGQCFCLAFVAISSVQCVIHSVIPIQRLQLQAIVTVAKSVSEQTE